MRWVTAATVVMTLLAGASQAGAECVTVPLPRGAKPVTAREFLADWDLVFSATVTRSWSWNLIATQDPEFVFKVDRVWKGDVKAETTLLFTPDMEGFPLAVGSSYLITARFVANIDDKPMYHLGGCDYGGPLDTPGARANIVKWLGPGRLPAAP